MFKKQIKIVLMLTLTMASFSTSVSAKENKNEYIKSQSPYVNPEIEVYVNPKDGSKYADIDLNKFKDKHRINIYNNPETNEIVYIDVETIKEGARKTNGWSEGTIPDKKSTLTPHMSDGSIYAEFSADCVGDPKVAILDVYGGYVSSSGFLESSITGLQINNSTATTNRHARATLNLRYSSIGGAVNGYLMLELDYKGHSRLTWKF